MLEIKGAHSSTKTKTKLRISLKLCKPKSNLNNNILLEALKFLNP